MSFLGSQTISITISKFIINDGSAVLEAREEVIDRQSYFRIYNISTDMCTCIGHKIGEQNYKVRCPMKTDR